jgi:hypothetical protein
MKDSTYHNYTQQKIIPLVEADMSFLDEIDLSAKKETKYRDLPKSIEVIHDVLNKFKHHKATVISDWSHKDTPYMACKNI